MATYYVTQAGSGVADGTTYAKSMSVLTHNTYHFAADDIVYLCDTITSSVTPHVSGSAGHPITYRGDYAGHAGIIDGGFAIAYGFECDSKYFIVLDSITILNCLSRAVYAYRADHTLDMNFTIKNSVVHDVYTAGTITGTGVSLRGNHCTVDNCLIYNTASDGIYIIGTDFICAYCTIYNVNYNHTLLADEGDCIQIEDHSADYWVHHNTLDHTNSSSKQGFLVNNASAAIGVGPSVFEYNVCSMSKVLAGVETGGWVAMFNDTTNLQIIRNNIFAGGYKGCIGLFGSVDFYNNYVHDGRGSCVAAASVAGTINILNNTLYNITDDPGSSTEGGITKGGAGCVLNAYNNIISTSIKYGIYSSGGTVNADYNCFYAITTANYNGCSGGAHDISSNPLLSGYILQACSPCIRAGNIIETVTHDIDGRKRPGRPGNSYSIGCWEYLGTNDPDHDENCRLPYR